MLRRLQKLTRFRVSHFKVAIQKMQQTKDEQWRKDLPDPVKSKLQELYKEATQDYKLQTPYGCVGKQDAEETQFWAKYMSFSEKAAQSDYVSYVHAILLEQKKSIFDPDPEI